MKKFALLVLIIVSACDSAVETEAGNPCFPAPEGEQADFFPLAVGNTWTFHHAARSRSMASSYEEEGTLVWRIVGVECSANSGRYSIEEERSGTGRAWNTFTQTWDTVNVGIATRVIQLTETAEGKLLLPYGDEPFDRYHPATEDTVSLSAGDLNGFNVGGLSDCSTHGSTIRLTKEEGLVFYDGGCGRASHSLYLMLELAAFEEGEGT